MKSFSCGFWLLLSLLLSLELPAQDNGVVNIPDTDPSPDEQEQDRERRGPGNFPFQFLNQIESDYEFESNTGILNIFRNIYRDANPRSGYYYYLPAEYNLNWKEEIGEYALYINFTAATGSGRGEAVVTAELKPNISRQDISIAQKLLEQYVKTDPVASEHPIHQLNSMPLSEPPKVSFSQLRNYGVNPEDIIVRTPTDFLDPIVISWRMAQVDDLLTGLYNNVGLNGNLTLVPDGEGMPVIEIPINLKIDDPRTFGRFAFEGSAWRSQGWQNPTDYPLILRNFHVMRLKEVRGETQPYIYTWKLGNVEVPEKARVEFDASLLPTWVDNHPSIQKMWLEYTVKPCQSCNQTVRNKIMGGVSANRINRIEVTTLTPLAFTGAVMMKIKLRSIQADPNGVRQIELPTLTIKEDFASMSGGELFVDAGERPDFEYQLTLYMEDGTFYESQGWQKSSRLEVVIGERQIRDLVPHFR